MGESERERQRQAGIRIRSRPEGRERECLVMEAGACGPVEIFTGSAEGKLTAESVCSWSLLGRSWPASSYLFCFFSFFAPSHSAWPSWTGSNLEAEQEEHEKRGENHEHITHANEMAATRGASRRARPQGGELPSLSLKLSRAFLLALQRRARQKS